MNEKHTTVVSTVLNLLAVIILWVVTLTVALPITVALFLSTEFQNLFFSWTYVHFLQFSFQFKLVPLRKKMFQLLREDLSAKKTLQVLEIGIGDGANLPYYPNNCQLTVVDKNKFFEPYFRRNAEKYPHISYKRTVIQPAEDMKGIEDNSMDVVVTSLFQCSCEDPDKVLQEILRVLKPGGKYVCLEHVAFPENSSGLLLQKFIQPLWVLYSNGCILDRDMETKIRRAGFSKVRCEPHVFTQWWMYVARHFMVAVATK